MKNLILLCMIAAAGSAGAASAPPRCVLPVPDGKAEEPSPPSMSGVVLRVELPRVVLRTADDKVMSVLIEKDTKLFTTYGGGLDAEQLAAGQHERVWLRGCAPTSVRSRHAAVFTVCSISPEPCAK